MYDPREEHEGRWLFEGAFILSAIATALFITHDLGLSGMTQGIVAGAVFGLSVLVFVSSYREFHSCSWGIVFLIMAVYLLWRIGFLTPLIDIILKGGYNV